MVRIVTIGCSSDSDGISGVGHGTISIVSKVLSLGCEYSDGVVELGIVMVSGMVMV